MYYASVTFVTAIPFAPRARHFYTPAEYSRWLDFAREYDFIIVRTATR